MIYSRRFIIEPCDDRYSQARMLMPDAEKSVLDAMTEVYTACKIVPYEHKLEPSQLASFRMIRCNDEWQTALPGFKKSVELMGCLTIDVESYTGNKWSTNWRYCPRIKYVILGDMVGTVLVIDMDQYLRREELKSLPKFSLPSELEGWINRPDIYILGSNIAEDLSDMKVEGQSVVDTGNVFKHYMANATINIGSTSRYGLGPQQFYSKTFDNKCMPETKFIKMYGPHKYVAYPKIREKGRLFQWEENDKGNLCDYAIHYMYHDGSSNASLMARIFMDLLIKKYKLPDKSKKSVRHLYSYILKPFSKDLTTFEYNGSK